MGLFSAFLRRPRAKPDEGRAPHAHAHAAGRERAADRRAADRHERDRAPLTQFRDDPIGFIAHALPNAGAPYPKQLEMLQLVANERRVSVVGCNGAGKDWVARRRESRPQRRGRRGRAPRPGGRPPRQVLHPVLGDGDATDARFPPTRE